MTRFASYLFIALVACSSSDGPTTGPIRDRWTTDDQGGHFKAVRHRVPVAELLPSGVGGLPVTGTLEIEGDVTLPRDGLRNLTGSISIRSVEHCRIGDDVAKLQAPGRAGPFIGAIEVGHIDISRFEASAKAADGHLELSRFVLESPDMVVHASLQAELRPSLGSSTVTGCIRFKPTEGLDKRNPKLYALLTITGAASDPEGFFDIALEGPFDHMKRFARVCATET